MAETSIEWTDATWNPVAGCTVLTAGCTNCYAMRMAARLDAMGTAKYRGLTRKSGGRAVWTGRIRVDEASLDVPRSWSKPRKVFVNSMSDLFHHDVPDDFVVRVFDVMLRTDRHVYQVLTKRPARAVRFWNKFGDVFGLATIPAHIWMGTSVENQDVNYRVRHLADLPARIRFLSCEPLLGRINLDLGAIHWVIAGGESGPERRAMESTWVEMIRDQCVRARVPFFFKQWGGRTPKAGGRKLGGREWSQLPDLEPAVA